MVAAAALADCIYYMSRGSMEEGVGDRMRRGYPSPTLSSDELWLSADDLA